MKLKSLCAAASLALLLACTSYAQEQLAGVGLVLAVHHEVLTVVHVMTNTPASKAGLGPGLLVEKIDGAPTKGKLLKECIDKIRGPVGTKVKLQLADPANHKTNTVELTRENISVK